MNAQLIQLIRTILTQEASSASQPHYNERTENLHRAFYRLKSEYGEAFPALGKLHFITAGAFPYSPDLTEALDALQMSGTLFRQNPHFDRFGARYYDDLPDLAEEDRRELIGGNEELEERFDSLVEDFRDAITVHPGG